MGKRYSKRSTRKVKLRLSPKDAQKIIETEFTDSHNNKIRFRVDFNPHPIDEPTFRWQRVYGENK